MLILRFAGPEWAKNLAGKNVLRLIQIRLTTRVWKKSRQPVKTIRRNANRRFEFRKSHQLFIRTHDETVAVGACASATKIVRPPESTVETQPQLQPALLRLSAMISQYFTPTDSVSFSLYTAMMKGYAR
jgi:hypothetical protein